MSLFSSRASFCLVFLCLPLLFLPKINLIRLDAATMTGLRIDDFVLCAFAFMMTWAHFSLRKGFLPIETWIISILFFSLFSWICNRILISLEVLHVQASLFHCVRLLEYFLFFYIGILAYKTFPERAVIRAFFLWNLAIMLLQRAGLIGEFSSLHGYMAESTYRVAGIASFPSEMGALLNLLFCYFLYAPEEPLRIIKFPTQLRPLIREGFPYFLFFLFMILVAMTGSRIAIVALALPFLNFLRQRIHPHSLFSWLLPASILLLAIGITLLLVMQTDSIATRSQGLLSWRNIDLIRMVWDNTDITQPLDDLNRIEYGEYDMSWWIRIHKWCYAVKTYVTNPACYLQGIGPGATGMALDGGLLRIFLENGIFGSFLYFKMFSSMARQSTQLYWMIVAFMINMIFFDVYLAYKPMGLLFLLSGYAYAEIRASFSSPSLMRHI